MPTDNLPDRRTVRGARDLPEGRGRKGVVLGRKGVFLVGLGSGVFIASQWRSLVKRGIRVAVKSGARAQRMVARGAENVADLTREAMADMEMADMEMGDIGRAGRTALPPASVTGTEAPADASAGTTG